MSTPLISGPSEHDWIERGWDDQQDRGRPPILGVALLAALAAVTAVAVVVAIWLLATGQVG